METVNLLVSADDYLKGIKEFDFEHNNTIICVELCGEIAERQEYDEEHGGNCLAYVGRENVKIEKMTTYNEDGDIIENSAEINLIWE